MQKAQPMKRTVFASVVLLVCLALGEALAEPLVRVTDQGVEPNVIVSWSGSDREVELTVRSDADPSEVAAVIEQGLDRVKAKVRGSTVIVRGKTVEELLPLLADVQLGTDEPLNELAQLSALETDFGSGSSLRAKIRAHVDQAFSDPDKVVQAQVVKVEVAEFPRARVTLRVLKSPRGDLKKVAARGQTIVVIPMFAQTADGRLDYADVRTQMNVGAYFLEPQDRVRVSLGGVLKSGALSAEAIAR